MAEDTEKICRICLKEVGPDNKSYNIFEKYEDFLIPNTLDDISIAAKLMACADVKIKYNDGLPSRICSDCVLELEDAYKFRKICENSDGILRNGLRTNKDTRCLEFAVKEEDDIEFFNEVEASLQSDDTKSELNHMLSADLNPEDDQITGDTIESTQITNNVSVSKTKNLKLECQDCGDTFKSQCKLRVHRKTKHLPITCLRCKNLFKSFHAYNKHQKNKPKICISMTCFRIEGVSKARHFHCRECLYSTKNVNNAMQHSIVHNKISEFKCDQCDRVFLRSITLRGHKERAHNEFTGQKTCHFCGKVFLGFTNFDSHMRSHRKKGRKVCDICNKTFATTSSLYAHKYTHSDKKAYACDKCPGKFRTSAGLYNHVFKHNEKRFSCKVCNYKAKNPYKIKKHEKEHDGMNLACGECGKFYVNESELALHKKSHVKNHPCDYCDRVYAARKNLTEHLRKAHQIYVSSSDFKGLNVKKKKTKLN